MIPGVAALLLQRGCPEERLDHAMTIMGDWPAPTTLIQAVRDADRAIEQLDQPSA